MELEMISPLSVAIEALAQASAELSSHNEEE